MELPVLDHPLVEHKLTVLRDKNTSSATFRELVTELVMLEAYEATRNLDIVDKPIETPVAPMVGKHIASPAPIIVPVLRAGLGMLDGMTKMIPTAEVGFLGMKRDEEHPTQQITYANRLPEDLTGRQCFLIDPMLATGGTPRHRHPLPRRARCQRRHRHQHHRRPRRHPIRPRPHRSLHRLQGRRLRRR